MKRTFGFCQVCSFIILCAVPVLAWQEKETQCLSEECVSGWGRVNLPDSNRYISALATYSPSLIIAGNDSGVFSANYYYNISGLSWSRLSSMIVTSVATDSSGVNVYAGTYGGGLLRINSSASNNTGLTDKYVKAIARDSRGFLYVLSSPSDNAGYSASCSFDSGKTWISIGKPNTVPAVSMTALAVNANNDLFTGTDKGVFRYVGGYWDSANTGTKYLPDSQVNALAIDRNFNIFVGTNHGAYFSRDSGASWNVLGGPGLPNHITALAPGTAFGMMPIVGSDSGLFEYMASTPAAPKVQQLSVRISSGHCLEFNLVKTELVDLRLYDARGVEKVRLLHGVLSSGAHELRLPNISEGVYFCRTKIGADSPTTRKIAVLLSQAR